MSYEYLSEITNNENKREASTRSSQSILGETEPSLDGSQLINMISYQVDQETFVREACEDQSEYFLELMSQCKISVKKIKNWALSLCKNIDIITLLVLANIVINNDKI